MVAESDGGRCHGCVDARYGSRRGALAAAARECGSSCGWDRNGFDGFRHAVDFVHSGNGCVARTASIAVRDARRHAHHLGLRLRFQPIEVFMKPTSIVRAVILTAACLPVASASAQPSKLSPFKVPGGPQGFSVVLVLGDAKAATTPVDDSVPAAARKALSDMKDFLPYRSYRLLDAQWILGSERASTRLRGVDEQEYQLTLRATAFVASQPVRVTFQLTEPGSGEGAAYAAEEGQRRAQLAAMQDRIRQLELELVRIRALRSAEAQREVEAINAQITELRNQMAATEPARTNRGRTVIDTSFAMDIGETVVVGTSRVRGGDKALIALLTAVPRSTTSKREN